MISKEETLLHHLNSLESLARDEKRQFVFIMLPRLGEEPIVRTNIPTPRLVNIITSTAKHLKGEKK